MFIKKEVSQEPTLADRQNSVIEDSDLDTVTGTPDPEDSKEQKRLLEDSNSDFKPERPRKKQRVLLDSVMLPTMAMVKEEDKYKKIMSDMKNPKAEVKPQLQLGMDVFRARFPLDSDDLKPYPVELEDRIEDISVRREFLASRFGGNPQKTFPEIGKAHLARHGMDDFMYPVLRYNPYAPQKPGAPGLWFCVRAGGQLAEEWAGVERVIVGLKAADWLYIGQYELKPTLSLSVQEWNAQESEVRNAWIEMLVEQKGSRLDRARVHLRSQLGRNPTDKELDDALATGGDFEHITHDDFVGAFARGEETIAAWKMICVGYDADFQREIVAHYAHYVLPKRQQRGQGKSEGKKDSHNGKKKLQKAPKSAKMARPKSKSRKRRKDVHDDDDEKDESDEMNEEPVYQSKGTRSRRIL